MGKLNGSLKVTLLFFKEKKSYTRQLSLESWPSKCEKRPTWKKKSYVNDKIGIFCQ